MNGVGWDGWPPNTGDALTGTIPLVRSVGYLYASLLWVLERMFCSVVEMSKPSALSVAGTGAADAPRASEVTTATKDDIMMAQSRSSWKDAGNETDERIRED